MACNLVTRTTLLFLPVTLIFKKSQRTFPASTGYHHLCLLKDINLEASHRRHVSNTYCKTFYSKSIRMTEIIFIQISLPPEDRRSIIIIPKDSNLHSHNSENLKFHLTNHNGSPVIPSTPSLIRLHLIRTSKNPDHYRKNAVNS
jgi:hypothetical protein